jgi:hypothetical protein
MLRILTFLLPVFIAVFMMAPSAHAQIKDTVYFMKDDNEFSPEEMDEEALYIFEQCQQHALRSVYFDCGCIAGAYRQEREKKGPYMPQSIIVNSLFSDNEQGCANTVGIAGNEYESCMESAKIFRSRQNNNEEYCECVANTTARNFKKDPRLSLSHIEDVAVQARLSCDN